jgi:hypothetical protein
VKREFPMVNANLIRFKAILLYCEKFKTFNGNITKNSLIRYLTVMGINSQTGLYHFIEYCKTMNLLYQSEIGMKSWNTTKNAKQKTDELLTENEKQIANNYAEKIEKNYKTKEEV